MTRAFRVGTLLLGILFLEVSLALSTEWYLEPAYRLKGEFNDNLTLTDLPHSTAMGNLEFPLESHLEGKRKYWKSSEVRTQILFGMK